MLGRPSGGPRRWSAPEWQRGGREKENGRDTCRAAATGTGLDLAADSSAHRRDRRGVVLLGPAVDGIGIRIGAGVDARASEHTLTTAGGSCMADIDRDRLRRDAAGIGPYARDAERLVPLKDMGKWDVAEGEPDIRGWEVRTVGGRDRK